MQWIWSVPPHTAKVLDRDELPILIEQMHQWCTQETQCFPIVFNESQVTHLASSPRSERAWRGPLRR